MKAKNRLRKLLSRVIHWETNKVIQENNRNNPGSNKKPGSQKK